VPCHYYGNKNSGVNPLDSHCFYGNNNTVLTGPMRLLLTIARGAQSGGSRPNAALGRA
jgi:hypothetical protein